MPVSQSVRRAAVVLLFGLLFAVLPGTLLSRSAPADAHALVNATFPPDGAVLDEVPAEVSLNFNEGVSAPTAGIRVYDTNGDRVDLADASVDPADGSRIRTALRPGLGDGTYIVTWRAVSADGHPLKGAWLFQVGDGGEVGDDLLAALFASGGDRSLVAAAVLTRAVGTGASLLVAGLAGFVLLVAGPRRRSAAASLATPPEQARLTALASRGAVVGVVATVLSVPLQAMLETGLGLGALAPAPLADVLASPVGLSAVVRTVLLGALWWRTRGRSTEVSEAALDGADAVLGAAALLTWALEGHSLTQDPVLVILLGDVVHVLAAAIWAGGLVALLLLARGRRRDDDAVGAAQLVAGFSRLATWSLLVLAVAGSAMGWVTVRAARALTTTGYGLTLLTKVALVAALALVGLYNRRRLVPAIVAAAADARTEAADARTEATPGRTLEERIGDGAWIRLRQTLRVETAVVLAVVGVTGLLVGQQPASQEAGITGAYTTYVDLSAERELNLVVDPNRVGLNEIHVYVLDRQGRPVAADEVRFVLEQPENDLGPFDRVPEVAGPGHWSLVGRELAVAGEWQVTVIVRTGTFTEEQVTVPVVVNR